MRSQSRQTPSRLTALTLHCLGGSSAMPLCELARLGQAKIPARDLSSKRRWDLGCCGSSCGPSSHSAAGNCTARR
eukprot:1025407-Rhodomonas_salina.4